MVVKLIMNIYKNLRSFFQKKIEKLESNIFKLVGEDFNIGSPKQLGEILF